MWYPTPQNPHIFVMHHKQTIDRQVYDATKHSPALTEQEEDQNLIPMSRKVGHFIVAFLSLSFIISSCTSYQHPDLEIRQLGFQLTPAQDAYLDTANAFAVLKEVRGTKHKLDSLLTWTDMLKDHDEERALIYANEAYRLATEKNYRLSRAIAMSYRALFKGRGTILGEGVDDALSDAKISYGLIKPHDPLAWQVQVYGILGHSYYKTFRNIFRDSAIQFEMRALELNELSRINDSDLNYHEAQILQDLANVFLFSGSKEDSASVYFENSLLAAQRSGNNWLLSRIWRDYARLFDRQNLPIRADSAYKLSIRLSEAAGDEKGLVNTYQQLSNLYNTKFINTEIDSFFELSNLYLRECLKIQKKRDSSSTLYYTYLILAYNFHVKFDLEVSKNSKDPDIHADSALFWYRLAMEQAGQEGAIRIMPTTVKNISELCSTRKKVIGKDCEELVVKTTDDYYFKFINDNYDALVNTVREELSNSNEKFRNFEKNQAQAVNSYRLRRNWSISASGLLIAGLIFLIVLQVLQRKRLQARMDALRAQINPHFMSNSLNAIENLVNRKENAAAAKYLIHFSRLSRKILTSSRNALTTLSEELKTLEHFLALEQLRFRDKLSYEITISDDLNSKTVQIPALILQPYVENAIWHGIKPKQESSLLQIKVEKEGKSLKCTIEDDGVGRKKAQELKEQTILVKHKSQGMKITEERLQKIGKVKGSKVEIIDLYDENGHASGTRVIIRMPLKEV